MDTLTIEQADHIRSDYGKFLEQTNGNLMMLFMGQIPECLLPYPKAIIEQAMDVCVAHFHKQGNNEAVTIMEGAKANLLLYIDNAQAIKKAEDKFKNPKILKVILSNLSNSQNKLLEYVTNK